MSHIIGDMLIIYNALKNNEVLPEINRPPYKYYILWLSKQNIEKGMEYWREYLTGYEQIATLPKIQKQKKDEYRAKEYKFIIDEELTTSLNNIAKANHTTINIVFKTIWGISLQKYNNTDDVVYGTVVSARTAEIEDIEKIIGLLLNTLPVRIKAEKGYSFTQLLQIVHQNTTTSLGYEYCPLYLIQSLFSTNRSLMDHILAFENYPSEEIVRLFFINGELKDRIGYSIEHISIYKQTNYDFNIIVFPGDNLNVIFYYNSLVYEKDTIKKIANHISYGYNNDYKILFELNDCGKNKKISIICIPYAGGVGTAYQNLACEISSLNDRIALYSIALPGYDISYEETCGNFIQKIAIECVKEITNNISTPIIVYGNCAGSALALEISKLIQQTEGELVCVILGAAILISRTSNIIQFINPWKYISDKRIYKIMKNLGAFSEDVSSETLNIIIKKFRRDTDIAFKYFTEIYNKHDQVKLNVPIYNIIGNVDSFTKKYKKDSIIGDCFLTQLNLLKLKMAGIILLLISHL